VLVDVEQFERMQEALAFGQAVDEGAAQAERGEFATNAEVEAVLGRRAMGA
jgi:predicted transcriptional regulator